MRSECWSPSGETRRLNVSQRYVGRETTAWQSIEEGGREEELHSAQKKTTEDNS